MAYLMGGYKMESILNKNQKKIIVLNDLLYNNEKVDLIINIRYDDACNNGHNTFSITGDLYTAGKRGDKHLICCGCIHDIIEKLAPDYKKYIKWHLCSSEGPLYYLENTLYWANPLKKFNHFVYLVDDEFKIKELLGIFSLEDIEKIKSKYNNIIVETKPETYNREPDLINARKSAIWEDATIKQLQNKKLLLKRLPKLKAEFKKMVESLGFIY